jgi:hypothetical protein
MPRLIFLFLGILITIGGCSTKVVEDDTDDTRAPQIESPSIRAEVKPRIEKQLSSFKRTPWRGFNALQTSKVAWNSPAARQSLLEMVALGANSVALIPFLKQSNANSTDVRAATNVTNMQLIAAIKTAHQLGLKVVIKPQVLVRKSWAGGIYFKDHNRLHRWFKNYSAHILMYARMSQKLGVEAFVIGTELSKIAKDLPWLELIAQLRRVFKGKLTYAAHNVKGVERFPYWYKLDVIGISLYPSLGDMGEYDEMLAHVEHSMYKLNQIVEHRNKPVWLLEIGMPSAVGFSSQPWAWKSLHHNRHRPDMTMQSSAVAAWLNAIRRLGYVDGVFFWNWYSDPHAGGERNLDYTVQNKPAEIVIRQFWRN